MFDRLRKWLAGEKLQVTEPDKTGRVPMVREFKPVDNYSEVHQLFLYLQSPRETVRSEALNQIREMFAAINSKGGYHQSLKYCQVPISFLRRAKEQFDHEDYLLLLKIGSLNHDGYVR